MDSQKDINSINNSNKGQLDSSVDSQEASQVNGLQHSDIYLSSLIKRTEKLTTALFMITDFMSDSNPLKMSLREKTLDLFLDISSAEHKGSSFRADQLIKVSHSISEIVSLSSIARSINAISEMNYTVLEKEYTTLREIIEGLEEVKDLKSRMVFPENFFDNSGQLEQTTLPSPDTNHSNDLNNIQQKDNFLKDTSNKGQKKVLNKNKIVSKTTANRGGGKIDRRRDILKSIRSRKESTIKDIIKAVPGCSEKTIQRELIAMVKEGVLKKKGERRWSRYFV